MEIIASGKDLLKLLHQSGIAHELLNEADIEGDILPDKYRLGLSAISKGRLLSEVYDVTGNLFQVYTLII